ncbi:MAG: hypothetical protein MI810_01410 [Flavobacteriales bacterium]|nr:hypothetical protein [Flavobacteriales bacterium]
MTDFRENYLKARKIIAEEIKSKHNLVESYQDENRLTLNSSNHSIHLTFYVPDTEDIVISDIGTEPGHGKDFKYYLFEKYPNNDERAKILKGLYKDSRSSGNFDFSVESIEDSLRIMIGFMSKNYPSFFL